MIMRTFYIIACGLIAATSLISCNKEESGSGNTVLGRVEFSATIEDSQTKVTAGEFGDGTLPLIWSVGDAIRLVYGEVAYDASVTYVAPDGSATIVAEAAPENEIPDAAWYPGEDYSQDTGVAIPVVQHHGKLPIILKGTATDSDRLTFKAESSTLLCYPLTGDITIKSAALYLTDIPALWGGAGDIELSPSYTLEFDEPLQLSEEEQYIWFAVPDENKIATLEITTDAPEGSLVSEYKYYRRKLSALSFSTGNIQKMPALNFDKATIETESSYKYVFGTNNDGIGNLKTNVNRPVEVFDNYATTSFYAASETQTRLTLDYTVPDLNVGNARYAAYKSDIPYIIFNPGNGYSAKGTNINIDLRICNQMWQGRYPGTDNKPIYYSGEIDCGDNTTIRYYDLLGTWRLNNGDFYEPTSISVPRNTGGTTALVSAITYQDESGNSNIAQDGDGKNYLKFPITARIYWMGFFNSIDEIKAFAAEHE